MITREGKTAIDWTELHARLERAQRSLTKALAPGPEETRRVLRERACELAVARSEPMADEFIEVVQFLLGEEVYAVEARFAREVCSRPSITPIPFSPPIVPGIMNLRGEIVSIVDLARVLGHPPRSRAESASVVVLEEKPMYFGILADAVVGLRRLPLGELGGDLPALGGSGRKYLRGVARDRTVVLDGAALLRDEALVVREQVNET